MPSESKVVRQSLALLVAQMQVAEKKDISGENKKRTVLTLVNNFIQTSSLDSVQKERVALVSTIVLPLLIDIIVAASKNVFDLNRDGVISSDEVSRKLFCCCLAPKIIK